MTIAAWILLIGLIAWLVETRLYQTTASFVDTNEKGELILKRNRSGHYLITAKINGIAVKALLDTGATRVSISNNLAQKLNLQRGIRYTVITANGNADAYHSRLDSLQIGSIKQTQVAATIIPNMQNDLVLIGMNFLKHLHIVQQNDTLIISWPTKL